MAVEKICPFMSRPVLRDRGEGVRLGAVGCLRERCAAWSPDGWCTLMPVGY